MHQRTFPLCDRLARAFACSALCAALLAGVQTQARAQEAPITVGMSFQELNNVYFVTMQQALEARAREHGATLVITDARHDVAKQLNDVEDMLQRGIDVLLLNPADSVGIQSAVLSAEQAGVPVIAVDAQAAGPVTAFVGSKNRDAGYQVCHYLAKQLGGEGRVAILDGIPVVPILERVEGCEAALGEFADIHIVTKQNGRQDRTQAMSVTENILQAHPDLDGIFSVNDVGSLGALSAIEASGLNPRLVSVDGNPEAVQALQEADSPLIAIAAQHPRQMVERAFDLALAAQRGEAVPAEVPIDIELVTRDNASAFSW